jgi:hypothetical protein
MQQVILHLLEVVHPRRRLRLELESTSINSLPKVLREFLQEVRVAKTQVTPQLNSHNTLSPSSQLTTSPLFENTIRRTLPLARKLAPSSNVVVERAMALTVPLVLVIT